MPLPDRWSPTRLDKVIIGGMGALCLEQLGHKDPMNENMAAGIAVEDAVKEGLLDHDKPVELCAKLALAKFDRLMALKARDVEKVQKKRGQIPGMVAGAIQALRQFGVPDFDGGDQHWVELKLEGVTQKIVGKMDFKYDGVIVEFKTTTAMPGAIRAAHARQAAIYGAANGNYAVKVCYATQKKCEVYDLEDQRKRIEEVRLSLINAERFLNRFETWEAVAQHVVPNYSSFYMSSDIMRAAGKELWGF